MVQGFKLINYPLSGFHIQLRLFSNKNAIPGYRLQAAFKSQPEFLLKTNHPHLLSQSLSQPLSKTNHHPFPAP